MPSKSAKPKTSGSSGSSSRNITKPIPKARPPSHRKPLSHPHYLVVDTTLPSHIFSDRSLFTTYAPSRKSHQTVFGSNIIIEGIGDVHVRVFVSGKSILFRFRDSWHVPSSPHHFFSCSATISLGNHFMIASRSPRMIFSHKHRLAEPNLPKYVPFVRVDGLIVLPFDIPAQGSFSLEPESTSIATRSTTQTSLSLPASALLVSPSIGIFQPHSKFRSHWQVVTRPLILLAARCWIRARVLSCMGVHMHWWTWIRQY